MKLKTCSNYSFYLLRSTLLTTQLITKCVFLIVVTSSAYASVCVDEQYPSFIDSNSDESVLSNCIGHSDGQIVKFSSYNDEGAASWFKWKEKSVGRPDGLTVIEPNKVIGSGRWHRLNYEDSLMVESFGVREDLEDNSTLLKAAFLFGLNSKRVTALPGREYKVKSPITIPSGSNIDFNGSTIRNTLKEGALINSSAIFVGTLHPKILDRLEYLSMYIYRDGVNSYLKNTAKKLKNGDVIFIRSEKYYTGNNSTRLFFEGQLNVVLGIRGTDVQLAKQYPFAAADVEVAVVTRPFEGFGRDSELNSLSVGIGTRIEGMSISSDRGNATMRGGCIDCVLKFDSIKGRTGVYANSLYDSVISIADIDVDKKVYDLAGNSHNNVIEIKHARWTTTERTGSSAVIGLNEFSLGNYITVDELNIIGGGSSQSLVAFRAASNNSVKISQLKTDNFSGHIYSVVNRKIDAVDGNQVDTIGNFLEVNNISTDNVEISSLGFYNNAGGRCSGNYMLIGPLNRSIHKGEKQGAGSDKHCVHSQDMDRTGTKNR